MLTCDDILGFRSLHGGQISPDGMRAVYEVGAALAGRWSEPGGSQLWLVETGGGEPRQLTFGGHRDSAPAWSPGGRQIAFLSNRGGRGNRLQVLSLDGGEARPLDSCGPVKRFAWSPDGRSIAVVCNDRADADQNKTKEAPIVVEEDQHFDRVWIIDIQTGVASKATEAAAHTWELCWLPDGNGLALVVADEPTPAAWYGCRLARLNLASGHLVTLLQPPTGRQVARPVASPDGRWIACVSCSWSDPGMSGGDLWVVAAAPESGSAPRNLTQGIAFSVNCPVWDRDSAALFFDAYDDNQVSIGRVTLADGAVERHWRDPSSLTFSGLSFDAERHSFVALRTDARHPAELWRGVVAHDTVTWRQLTDLHGEEHGKLQAEMTEVRWTADDGLTLGGWVMRPPGASGPTPLVAIIHGGPTAMAANAFNSRGLAALAPLLAARGIAAFMPNYRGSNGRGVAFAESNHGDMCGADWRDILAGLDHLVATGVAYPGRLGICGWSYGGLMTMWGVTQSDRFQAAVAGAGIANWVSFHGVSTLHTWDRLFFEADPYDSAGIYTARSALFHVAKATTPTLILHGDADRDVPPSQGYEFFRALKEHGVATQFVRYPGAAHGPSNPHHIRDILDRSLDWLTSRLLDQ